MTNPQTDTGNVIQQLIDSISTEQQTLGERMKDHLVDLFDYKKYSDKKQGQRHTGKAVDISKYHGGFHIYCELCGYPLKCLSQTKVFTSPEYDIDIFAGIGDRKQRLEVQADFSYREMKDGKRIITKYIPLNNYRQLTDLSSLESVLDVFGIDLKTENTSVAMTPEPHNLLTKDGVVDISPTVTLALVNGVKDVEIHNDTGSLSLDCELTLSPLYAALNPLVNINGFDNQSIDFLCNQIRKTAALTANAITLYEEKRNRYRDNKSHLFVLQKIVKRWNPSFYNDVIIPLLRKENEQKEEPPREITVHEIDLNSSFSFSEIRDKACRKQYSSLSKVAEDLTKVLRFVEARMEFIVKEVKFFSDNTRIFSLFHGFKYQMANEQNDEIIKPFLDFTREVIANDNEELYQYILCWISSIVQNPGKKAETSLVLKGHSCSNVTEIAELSGQFNFIVEGKMLIVLNELKNVGDDRTANFDALKSIITDSTIRINEKNQPCRTAENVSNFKFVTNHTYPVKIEIGDRRYVVCDCNTKYKNNLTFFKDFTDSFDNEFYEQLLCYFISKNLSEFNTRAIPTMEAKEDIIAASLSVIDVFCQEHYNKLKEVWGCSEALCFRPVEYKNDRSFQLAIKDRCERTRVGGRGNQVWCYKLKPEYEQLLKRREDEDDIDCSAEIN
ncbi:putative Poxvirus D5 protein [Monocercomonoides exilis]|uniref:putative Poxvirus D5 protein n=1 Tax=Monocercomonoides exilis TaxID=2049356 RepID=UPI003559B14E|nr:putative Poxvirus D5 protein [Monocercomonoides exilis]